VHVTLGVVLSAPRRAFFQNSPLQEAAGICCLGHGRHLHMEAVSRRRWHFAYQQIVSSYFCVQGGYYNI